jgi:hypothetical protein
MARFAKEEVKTEKTKEQVAAGLKRLRDVKVTDDEVIINITKKRKLQDAGGELRALGIGLKDYDFQKKLPKAGQGLILLNKTEMDSRDLGDREYNMHLGAVVAYQPGMPATISDMSATEALPALEMMETREIKSVQEFRGGEEYPAGFFAMGLLEAEADT